MNGRVKILGFAAAAMAIGVLAACHDSDHGSSPLAAANKSEDFSNFTVTTFAQPANSTPVNFDNITLAFDVNDNPNAFNGLL